MIKWESVISADTLSSKKLLVDYLAQFQFYVFPIFQLPPPFANARNCSYFYELPISHYRFDLSVAHKVDLITVFQGSQPVGDHDDGAFAFEGFDGLNDLFFGNVVERGGSFIHDQYLGVVVKGTGNADALPLSGFHSDQFHIIL